MAAFNFVEPYLDTILGFIGVTDVTFVTAGGTAQLSQGRSIAGSFCSPIWSRLEASLSKSRRKP